MRLDHEAELPAGLEAMRSPGAATRRSSLGPGLLEPVEARSPAGDHVSPLRERSHA